MKFVLALFVALAVAMPDLCPAPSPTAQCSRHTDCATCIADPNCGYCSIIPYSSTLVTSTQTAVGRSNCSAAGCYPTNDDTPTPSPACPAPGVFVGASGCYSPCMDLTQGPGCCPNYPARWETGDSTIPGDPLTVPIKVTSPITDDLAIDLMLLLDLSGSFKNDLQTFAALVPSLVIGVKTINSASQFGLASFIETPLEPFGLQNGVTNFAAEGQNNVWNWPTTPIDTATTAWPLAKNGPGCPAGWVGCDQDADWICPLNALTFGNTGGRAVTSGPINWKYCLESPLSVDFTQLQLRLSALAVGRISHNNIDYPEPSLDGMFYASKCHSAWRPTARKVLTVITDARYHGTGPETCQLDTASTLTKGKAVCNVPFPDSTCAVSGCASGGTGLASGADAGKSWFDQGYFESEHDGDCVLQARTSATAGGIPQKSILPVLNTDGTSSAPITSWTYDATRRDALLPGTKEAFIHHTAVNQALRAKGVIPLITCAEDPTSTTNLITDKQNLWYWEDLIDGWGFGFAEKLIKPSQGQSNLVQLILNAIASISKNMVMVVDNTVDPASTTDALGYVTNVNPASRTFTNVQPGDQKTYDVTFFVPATDLVVDQYQIKLTILGFGDCIITVTNTSTCKGCQGNPLGREDMCGFCEPPAGAANQCVDCAGVTGGKNVYDICGFCGGDSSSCRNCRGNPTNSESYAIDQCGLCSDTTSPSFGTSCIGCDGVAVPGGGKAVVDLCGQCAGTNDCVACNDEVNGGAVLDDCGVCVTNPTEVSDSCRPASVAISPAAAAGIAIGIAIFVALAVIAAILIFARITKNFIDERKFMNAFASGNSVGTNPLHEEKVGWKENRMAQ